jgi:hypothetical protein
LSAIHDGGDSVALLLAAVAEGSLANELRKAFDLATGLEESINFVWVGHEPAKLVSFE